MPVARPEQQTIGLDDPRRETAPSQVEPIHYTRRKPTASPTPHGRNPLPATLPRKENEIEPDQDVSQLKKIGGEITEEKVAVI